jgi:hypothetical protein
LCRGAGAEVALLQPVPGDLMTGKPLVLFLCIHNSGRSLAAKVLLEHYGPGPR